MKSRALYVVAPWEILLLSLNGAGKTDEICKTGDSFSWQMGALRSSQYWEKMMEVTSVPLDSLEDLIQQAKNLKESSLGSKVRLSYLVDSYLSNG